MRGRQGKKALEILHFFSELMHFWPIFIFLKNNKVEKTAHFVKLRGNFKSLVINGIKVNF